MRVQASIAVSGSAVAMPYRRTPSARQPLRVLTSADCPLGLLSWIESVGGGPAWTVTLPAAFVADDTVGSPAIADEIDDEGVSCDKSFQQRCSCETPHSSGNRGSILIDGPRGPGA